METNFARCKAQKLSIPMESKSINETTHFLVLKPDAQEVYLGVITSHTLLPQSTFKGEKREWYKNHAPPLTGGPHTA